jgi:hypothetical protein
MATNGKSGTVPAAFATQGPSTLYPWAGQVAMRSGYASNATWAWFDVGPYGSSVHAHRDKLGLVVHARGSMLLADSGRFAYQGTDLSAQLHREYASFARAHNTLTIDGADQLPTPAVATAPVPAGSVVFVPDHDTAYGNMSAYDGLAGTATHTRGVYYQRAAAPTAEGDGDWLVVVDMLTSDRPRTLQATWHGHPNATDVSVDAATGVAVMGGVHRATGVPTTAQACVIPASGAATFRWENASLVRGVTQAPGVAWQGWYSQDYDDAWAAPTFVYEASVQAQAVTAWLIIPTATRGPCDATIAVISVGAGAVEVSVDFGSGPQSVSVPVGGA